MNWLIYHIYKILDNHLTERFVTAWDEENYESAKREWDAIWHLDQLAGHLLTGNDVIYKLADRQEQKFEINREFSYEYNSWERRSV